MKDLLPELHRRFCNQLNAAWLESIAKPGIDINFLKVESFASFLQLYREAREQGYEFIYTTDARVVMQIGIIGTSSYEEFLKYPAWQELTMVLNMLKQLEQFNEEAAQVMKKRFQMLQNEIIESVYKRYVHQFVLENGPFLPGSKTDEIIVAGYSGKTPHDMILVCLLQEESPQMKPDLDYHRNG